ncbi:MAG: hypothetical protein HOB20_12345 [Planctomycetaceae bacterium]|nr:hypothetical protein [Planctomycetaceae bacterium]
MFKLLCDDVSDSDGFLFKGEAGDKIRESGSMKSLTLASKYAGRYTSTTGKPRIPK